MPGATYLASFPGNTDVVGLRKESTTNTMADQHLIWGLHPVSEHCGRKGRKQVN